MTTVEKAGAAATAAFDMLAHRYRQAHPGVTPEQAFEKVYEDPAFAHLRYAMRNAEFDQAGILMTYEKPVAKAVPPEARGEVYNRIPAKAQQAHVVDPSQTVEQHFSRLYSSADAEGIELRKAERAERGVRYAADAPVADEAPRTSVGEASALAELQELAADIRRKHPFKTVEQAFFDVYHDADNSDLVRRERREAYNRLAGVTSTFPSKV
jgi:hypothetical protein